MSRTVRDVRRTRAVLLRYRAERLLRGGFAERRAKVLALVRARLRARGVTLDASDLEGCYSQAWHGLYARALAGEQIEDPTAWLALATFRRAIDEARSQGRERARAQATAAAAGATLVAGAAGAASARGAAAVPGAASAPGAAAEPRASAAPEMTAVPGTSAVPGATAAAGAVERYGQRDLAGELDDRTRLRELFEGLRLRLSEREREAASLCYLQGLSRAQAAARMGIGEARMRKLMEGRGDGEPGVAAKVGELAATIQAGGWCEQQSSLLRAYALGILDPGGERHAVAVAHTRECPACRAQVALLRGLAAALPPLPLGLPLEGRGRARRGPGRGDRAQPDRAFGRRAQRLHSLVRRVLSRAGGTPLGAKLAVVGGVALIGSGGAYLAPRGSTSPAGPTAGRGAGQSGGGQSIRARAGNSREHPPLPSQHPPLHTFLPPVPFGSPSASAAPRSQASRRGSGRSGRGRSSHAPRGWRQGDAARAGLAQAGPTRASPTRAGAASASDSAAEFSPERIRDKTQRSPAATSSLPSGGGARGEFGIEPGG